MTRSPGTVQVPEALRHRVRVIPAPPLVVPEDLATGGETPVCIDGGHVVRAFLVAALIWRSVVTLIPACPGQVRPLRGHGTGDVALTLVAARSSPNGTAQVACRCD